MDKENLLEVIRQKIALEETLDINTEGGETVEHRKMFVLGMKYILLIVQNIEEYQD